jgi:hypothetical protein
MENTFVISGLVRKRAELSGMVRALDRRKAALKVQLTHIDQSLVIFGYDSSPSDIRPVLPFKRRFKKRELPTLVRQFAADGVTNREIALAVIAHKGWDAEDRDLIAKITYSVKAAKSWISRVRRDRKCVTN